MSGAILCAGHRGHGDWDCHCHRPLLQICEWGGQRGCGVPWGFPVGCPQGWCRQEVWVVPLLGSRVRYQPCKAACLQGEGVLAISSSSSRAGCGQDLPCLACCLPASRLTLLMFPSCAGPLAPHAVRSHRGHRIHTGELTAGAGRGCQAGTGEGGIPPWSLPDTLCPCSSLPMTPNLCWGTGRTH